MRRHGRLHEEVCVSKARDGGDVAGAARRAAAGLIAALFGIREAA